MHNSVYARLLPARLVAKNCSELRCEGTGADLLLKPKAEERQVAIGPGGGRTEGSSDNTITQIKTPRLRTLAIRNIDTVWSGST